MRLRESVRPALLSSGIAIGLVWLLASLPLASATTSIGPAYGNFSFAVSSAATGTGVNLLENGTPNVNTGVFAFWHNSTVGQLGPSTASLGLIQGFEGSAVISLGSHAVSLKWQYSGEELLAAQCWSTSGAATMVATQKVEYNVYAGNRWLNLGNVTQTAWTYSATSACPGGYSGAHALSGSVTYNFPSISFPGGPALFFAYLYTNTSVSETSVSDVVAESCIDYILETGSCSGTTMTHGGSATLSDMIVTP